MKKFLTTVFFLLLAAMLGAAVFLYTHPAYLTSLGIALPVPVSFEEIDLTPYEDNWYFGFLDEEEKMDYAVIEQSCESFEAEVVLPKALDHDALTSVVRSLAYDYPQYRWLNDAYTYTTSFNDKIIAVEFDLDEEDQKEAKTIRTIADDILAGMPAGSEYEKYLYLYDSIVDTTVYDADKIDESQHIASVLVDRVSVCAGYAKTYSYLCDLAGLECVYVTGMGQSSQDEAPQEHAWNLIKLDEQYYWVDITWGDPIEPENDSDMKNYNYFCLDDDLFFREHEADEKLGDLILEYPVCDDNSYNYYVLNNMYFETYDPAVLSDYITEKIISGNNIIEMEFENETDYESFTKAISEGTLLADCIYQSQMVFSGASYIASPKIGALRIELYN